MSEKKKRVLLTGAAGYIGAALARDLEAAGHEVVGVTRQSSRAPERAARAATPEQLRSDYRPAQAVVCDLTDVRSTEVAIHSIVPCDVILHTASYTGGGRESLRTNASMLRNLLRATGSWQARWIHLSSVAVYGDDLREGPVPVTADLRPATDYGRSKLECEELLRAAALADCRILRISPVYSPGAMRNVAVRIYLPGTGLRMRIRPEPSHSLCALERLVAVVQDHVSDRNARSITENVVDPRPHRQNELAQKAVSGPILTVPERIFRLFYYMARLVPGRRAYQLRSTYWKLFRSNVYEGPAESGGARGSETT